MSQALRYAAVSDDCKAKFVARVATPGWLNKRFNEQDVSHLAGGLFHLLGHQPSCLVPSFVAPALKTRVGRGLLGLPEQTPAEASAILQLWAAAELAGARIFVHKVRWPGPALAEELVRKVWPHSAEIEGIGYIQQQLWMGLRLFARHHPLPVPMPREVISDTVRRWKITASEAGRTAVRKGWDEGMIRWIEQCSASSKCQLLKDRMSLSEALALSAA